MTVFEFRRWLTTCVRRFKESYQPSKYLFDDLTGGDSYRAEFQLSEVSFITQGKWFAMKQKEQNQLPNGMYG